MKNTYSTLKILILLKSNQISRVEINYLVETTQSYAYTYLKYRYKNLNKIFLSEDLTLQELAIDSIAQLFERNDDGKFIKLSTAFENWQPPIETEDQAKFFLNRLVAKSVEKYVSELLRDSDPFFSRILDSVNYQIEKHGYRKKQILGTTYIVENDEQKRIGSLPDTQFILELSGDLFPNPNQTIPNLFDYIKNSTDKEIAIPLNALVNKIKRINTVNFSFSDKVEFGTELTVASILERALKVSINKLDESYVNKGKISQQEKSGIEKALRNISLDMKDGGINPGLHKYFLEQFPEINFSDYESKYQNIFEYLYKVLRKEIVKQLDGSE